MNNPYTTDSVCGEKFYGRKVIIPKIMESKDNMTLVLGARRMGKTSLLRQIEYISGTPDWPSHIGVWVSLEGVQTQEQLANRLFEACRRDDNNKKFSEQIGFDIEILRGKGLFDSFSLLDKAMWQKEMQLILLFDEAGQLENVSENLLKDIQSFFRYNSQRIRLILAASQEIYNLYDTCKEWTTPPFLHGVSELTLSRLTGGEVESLIRQRDSEGKPVIEVSNETVSEIERFTDNQPFLIQCLCSVLYADGRLLDVTEQHLKQVFESFPLSWVFFDLCKHLSPEQRLVLLQFRGVDVINESDLSVQTQLPSYEIKLILHELTKLCYIKRFDGEYKISNSFFERWLNSKEADRISAMDREEITQEVEQQRMLRVIADKGAASEYEMYLSSLVELHKLRNIIGDFTEKGFIKIDRTYNLGGRKVEYYSLTKEGRKLLARLEKAS
ncbi:hypothetical protein FJZ31_20725 [Candidatus Poribacteria bacterium]|nr:hypothetical protein [Candidatus Poribacteria bacterium]